MPEEIVPQELPATSTTPEVPLAVTPAATLSTPALDAEPKALSWAEQRTAYAKGDDKTLAWLSRYSSQEAVIDALKAARQKVSELGTGNVKLGKDATPEQVAEYRNAQGIPADYTDYEIELPDGVELTEEGEGIIGGYLKAMHAQNATPAQVQAGLSELLGQHIAEEAEKEKQDVDRDAATRAQLAQEWGSEAQANHNNIGNILALAPEAIRDQLRHARLPDGSKFGSNVEAMRWLANLAREVNPLPTVVPASGMNAMQTIDTEMANIQKMMGDHSSDYWKGPKASILQARFRELVGTKERYAKR